jgi:hypothetical protein
LVCFSWELPIVQEVKRAAFSFPEIGPVSDSSHPNGRWSF